MAGLGRLTLSRRERMVIVEPRGTGMALITLRTADEVRRVESNVSKAEVDPEAVAIARIIIERRAGHFDPATFRDRYQDALRELTEAMMRGLSVRVKSVAAPNPVRDLMTVLKRSLAQESREAGRKPKRKPPLIAASEICYCRYRVKAGKKPDATVTETASRRRRNA